MSKQTETASVPMDVTYTPAWLTWVAATTTCLRALDVACDPVDVAGMTGYAFHLSVAEGLCPSGPTVLDWGALLPGVWRLGRATTAFQATCFTGPKESEAVREQYRAAHAMARREVEAFSIVPRETIDSSVTDGRWSEGQRLLEFRVEILPAAEA